MQYLINRLKEKSTWISIIMIVTSLGVKINPGLAETVIPLGMAVAGVVGFFLKEKDIG